MRKRKRSEAASFIPLAELDDRDLAAWCELADRSIEPNPFHHPDFVLPAARALGELDRVSVLRMQDADSNWTACLPVRRYLRWHRRPLPCLANWLHPYSYLGAPLLSPGQGGETCSSLIAAMTGQGHLGVLDLLPDSLRPSDDAAIEVGSFERAVLRRHDDPDFLAGQISSKHRREFKRQARLMAEQLGGPLEIVDRSDEAAAIDTFLTLEASGWKGREGTAMANDPSHARLLHSAAESFRERGAFELLLLECRDRVAAARCSFLAGDVSFTFKIAYDEDLGSYSPGRALELRAMDRFHDETELSWMDSCATPGNDYINRLWPDRRRLTRQVCPGLGPSGRLLRAVAISALSLRNRRAAAAARERDQDPTER